MDINLFFLERGVISLSQYFKATGGSLFFLLKVGISYKLIYYAHNQGAVLN